MQGLFLLYLGDVVDKYFYPQKFSQFQAASLKLWLKKVQYASP